MCDNSISVRSIAFYDFAPSSLKNLDFYITSLPVDLEKKLKDAEADSTKSFKDYLLDPKNFSNLFPVKNIWVWNTPFVTGKRYSVNWGKNLDWFKMSMKLSERWIPSDGTVKFHSTFIDVRQAINFYDVSGV